MRKLLPIFLYLVTLSGFAQTSLSFHHLGNATFQNSLINPAYIPEGKFFIGLPVLSGVHINFNNRFNYNDIINKQESVNKIDLNTFLNSLQRRNMVSTSLDLSLIHIATTLSNGMHFSMFANERVEVDFLYPKNLLEFVIEGNGSLLGETVKIGKTRVSATSYREYGLGFAAPLSIGGSVGIHVKYLQGFFNASTSGGFTADIKTDPIDYSLFLDMQNATLQTSGFEIAQGKTGNIGNHMIANNNRGMALDFGFTLPLNKYTTLSGSITDIGYISWKEDIKNYDMGDTLMRYDGFDLKDPGNIEETLKDSLLNKFENKLVKTNDPYTTMINPKAFATLSYLTPTGGEVIGSVGTRYIQGQWKVLLGGGYRQKLGNIFTYSVNVTKLPQQFFNVGAAFAVNGGPAQLYLAADQVINFDATKFQAFDFRVGLNLAFGRNSGEKKQKKQGPDQVKKTKHKVSNQSFLGGKVKVKGQEDIYTIITKQERRDRKEYDRKGDPIPKTKKPIRRKKD